MDGEERKITIIEGPPPFFEPLHPETQGVFISILEGPEPRELALTRVRALNGPALVERCYRAWRERAMIPLEFRTPMGTIQRIPIVAVHYQKTDEGDVLTLWVQLTPELVDEIVATNGWEDENDDMDEADI